MKNSQFDSLCDKQRGSDRFTRHNGLASVVSATVLLLLGLAWPVHSQNALSWGDNFSGTLGNGTKTNSFVPIEVSTSGLLRGQTVIQVAAGDSHSVALTSTGLLYAWGTSLQNQLGDTSVTESSVPVLISVSDALAQKTIIQIAAGSGHTLALTSDGTVWAWGYNAYGTLGDGTKTNRKVPVQVKADGALAGKTIARIAAGSLHSLALASDGTLYSWGSAQDTNKTINETPVLVETQSILKGQTIVDISAGGFDLLLTSEGKVYAWGTNSYGALGNGTTKLSPAPVEVQGRAWQGKKVTHIAAGFAHALATDSEGKVYAWGGNFHGALGNGSLVHSSRPVAIAAVPAMAGQKVIQVTAGLNHSLALTSEGRVFAWGRNDMGQLGRHTYNYESQPVEVNTEGVLSGRKASQIAAGEFHSLAIIAPLAAP